MTEIKPGRPEITTEQAYQEAFLAEEYLASGIPELVARGERMMKTFAGESSDATLNETNNPTAQGPKEVSGMNNAHQRAEIAWPMVAIEEDPREIMGVEALRSMKYSTERRIGNAIPVDMLAGQPVTPEEPIH